MPISDQAVVSEILFVNFFLSACLVILNKTEKFHERPERSDPGTHLDNLSNCLL